MIVKLLLDKKREGGELTREEIYELINGYTCGDVPDYQMAAFAMAVCCKGMTDAETLALTEAMRDSGTCLTWEGYPPTADKHSTGGVGDKLSLIVQPIAAACGLAVPSLTGRGLGLTGGTADKMESIPGYKAGLSLEEYRKVVKECGCSLAMQTDDIAPADKKLYALRDVTGTVPSIPLIVASILSKKLAEGAETLVFDVKCGSGAFMKTREQAGELAHMLVRIAKGAGRKAVALVTDMNEPLGDSVGNMIEFAEAYALLKGGRCARELTELSIELAARMLSLAKGVSLNTARKRCTEKLKNGEALERFEHMVKLHGGNIKRIFEPWGFDVASIHVFATESGYVNSIDANLIAAAAFELGAGRNKTDESIDYAAGVRLRVRHGDYVSCGDTLAELSMVALPNVDKQMADRATDLALAAFMISQDPPPPRKLILEVVS